MRRTQLYLEEDLWNLLHVVADREGTSISQLVRDAVRERYSSNFEKRREAMLALIGTRSDFVGDTDEYVRELRRGSTERLISRA